MLPLPPGASRPPPLVSYLLPFSGRSGVCLCWSTSPSCGSCRTSCALYARGRRSGYSVHAGQASNVCLPTGSGPVIDCTMAPQPQTSPAVPAAPPQQSRGACPGFTAAPAAYAVLPTLLRGTVCVGNALARPLTRAPNLIDEYAPCANEALPELRDHAAAPCVHPRLDQPGTAIFAQMAAVPAPIFATIAPERAATLLRTMLAAQTGPADPAVPPRRASCPNPRQGLMAPNALRVHHRLSLTA